MIPNFPVTPAVVDVGFPHFKDSSVSPMRPLFDVPDAMLQDIKEGLDALTNKRLVGGYFVFKGLCCAVGAGLLNAHSKRSGVSLDSLLRTNQGASIEYAEWANLNWCAVSGRVNDQFGNGTDVQYYSWNHPAVQKARYFYVYGIVASELALRGLL